MSGTLGKTYEERQLAKEVRDLALNRIKNILVGEEKVEKRFEQALLLKLAGAVLPRVNEVSGPEGKPIPILNVSRDNSDKENSPDDQEDQGGAGWDISQ